MYLLFISFNLLIASECSHLLKNSLPKKGNQQQKYLKDNLSSSLLQLKYTLIHDHSDAVNELKLNLATISRDKASWNEAIEQTDIFLRGLNLGPIQDNITEALTAELILTLIEKDSSIPLDVITYLLAANRALFPLFISRYSNQIVSSPALRDMITKVQSIIDDPIIAKGDIRGDFLLLLVAARNPITNEILLDKIRRIYHGHSHARQYLPLELLIAVSSMLDNQDVPLSYLDSLLKTIYKGQRFPDLANFLPKIRSDHRMIFISYLPDKILDNALRDIEKEPFTGEHDINGELLWFLHSPNQFNIQHPFPSDKTLTAALAREGQLSLALLITVNGLIMKVGGPHIEPGLSFDILEDLIGTIIQGHQPDTVLNFVTNLKLDHIMPYLNLPYFHFAPF